MVKLKWVVKSAPTGRFEDRAWPAANYINASESPALMLGCDDEYIPANVKSGQHDLIIIYVADHSVKPWKWRTLKARATTLSEAKKLGQAFLNKNPQFTPEL